MLIQFSSNPQLYNIIMTNPILGQLSYIVKIIRFHHSVLSGNQAQSSNRETYYFQSKSIRL